MKNFYLLFLGLFISLNLQSQAIYKTIDSEKLEGQRELKIQLPRNYNPEEKRTYPIIFVLDADYLFEPIAGNIDYQSYWEDIPDCIVVGVNQADTRIDDFHYHEDTNFPIGTGAKFYEFLAAELLPYIEDNYKASNFRIIFGHDLSANFINYYLFKDEPIFRAYVAFSPELAPEMTNRLQQRLSILKQETFYYMATADADIKDLRASTLKAHDILSTIENEKLFYKFDDFEDANHYALVGRGIPKALNEIFGLFKPINAKEYREKLLTYEGTPFEYLTKKYEDIEYFYGFEKELIENDIRAIAAASNKKDDLESLENLAKLVKKKFPDSMLSAYYLGMYYEKEGNLKKALLQYKNGLLLKPSQFVDKEIILEKMYDTQEALND
ncbi:alpha/beta hydrolase [Winogradskyella bathintestinalis]|uniref:Alpha/beta hydrolase-fold protein n=1 Tax=Winogradskyella bathintestinalis TaxID=3035208 RepID=A0ABT7ZS03_9FLAO|nr:alpha/beta hydrolase-fold protein [Winogradskyella bathintestinalis]MDN3491794.1 alpha/beta hydrolase-fold protein [Winogradskyella bathintestinalis]